MTVKDFMDFKNDEKRDYHKSDQKKGNLERELSRLEKLDRKKEKTHNLDTKEKDSHRDSVRSSERKGYLSSSENYDSEDISDGEGSKEGP